MKVYIDVGHGGKDSGAVGNGLLEKDVTLKIALKIRDKLLQYHGIEVKLSRTTDKTLTLDERTNDANKWGANFLLSIHVNAGGGVGYEDFIYSGISDSSTTAKIRNIIHSAIVDVVPFYNRGKKKANFHMLRESKMYALLTENGFIDNKDDANSLKRDTLLDDIAQGHVNGIVKAFDLKKKVVKDTPSGDTFYRVVTGSFKDRENAEQRISDLKEKGFESFIDIYKK